MKTVSLLGGSGFIGAHIARELVGRGYSVRLLVRPGSDLSLLEGMPVELVHGDLESEEDLLHLFQGCDALIHAAAYYPSYSLGKTRQVQRAVLQIRQIHDAMAASGIHRFVFISSLSAVGAYPDNRPEDENAPLSQDRLKGTYNSIKRAMQDWVLAEAKRFNSVVVAPTGVFGPGDRKPATGRTLVELAKGRLPVVLKAKLNVVDVRTVAMGTVNALERGRTGRLYVLGGVNTTLPEFMRLASRIAGVRPPTAALSPKSVLPLAWLSEGVGWLLRLKAPLLPVVGVDFAKYGTHLSSQVAVNEIGYVPEHVSTEQMLTDAFVWFRERGMV